jgi:hypothetical protein
MYIGTVKKEEAEQAYYYIYGSATIFIHDTIDE